MNRSVFLVCQLLFIAAVTMTVSNTADAQRRGVITVKSRPVYVEPARREDSRRPISAVDIEKEVFHLINAERRKKGLSPLIWNDRAAKAARLHSKNMSQQGFFSHRGRDGSMVGTRASRMGLQWDGIGENLVYFRNYADPAEFAVKSWMNSSGHKNNILKKNWIETGIGAVQGDDGSYYLTQVFSFTNENARKIDYDDGDRLRENKARRVARF